MRLAASLPTRCAACRSAGALEVTQTFARGELSWSEDFSCGCGHAFSAKSAGLPTPAAREALMAATGRCRVVVETVPPSGRTWKVLARILDAPEAQVRRVLGRLPAVAWEGSAAEARFMEQALGRAGAVVRVERVGRPGRVARTRGRP